MDRFSVLGKPVRQVERPFQSMSFIRGGNENDLEKLRLPTLMWE
jgi:hypothetical protein